MGTTNYDQTHGKSHRRKHDRKRGEPVDYAAIDHKLLVEAIRGVVKSGGALRLGLTRDQGAYAIGIYGEGDPYTEYFHGIEDLHGFLRELITDYGDPSELDL